ncbi:MAG: 16S rRNA (cytosine(1402)-N(4))-methyltransferase [Patescibacteria group bacterium]
MKIENLFHIPVLVKEVLEYLDPKPGQNFIDCTIGEGGHASEILKRTGPNGVLLGIDLDEKQIENAGKNLAEFKDRIILTNDSYANLKNIVPAVKIGKIRMSKSISPEK